MMRLFAGTPFDRPPHCDRCGLLESDCQCPPLANGKILRIALEKRKKGKVVTVIRGLPEANDHLPGLLSKLKSHCGAGGALREGALEIQGEHIERVSTLLQALGYVVAD